jgi:Ca-activated chloride channel family protein
MSKTQSTYRLSFAFLALLLTELLLAGLWATGYFVLLQSIPGLKLDKPQFLILFAIAPVLTLIFFLILLWKKSVLSKFSSLAMLQYLAPDRSIGKPVFKFILFRLALFFLTIALINPMSGSKMAEAKYEGIDLMIALDVSNSMLAEDIKPNRLTRSKRGISQLIDKLHGDRLGIIVFAGNAYVQLPITTDYSAARLFLSTIDEKVVPVQGTAIGAAIDLSMESFDFENATQKAIIIISDGENHEDDAIEAARKAQEKGVIIHTIGMGSAQGAPLPVYQGKQQTGYRKDNAGSTVISRLDEKMLQDIATAGGGIFVRATTARSGLNILLEEINLMNKTEFGTVAYAEYEDRFQIFLLIGIALLWLDLFILERKNKWSDKFNFFGS